MMLHVKNKVEILLIEDNPGDVELTVRAFKKHARSNNISVVRDGEEALEFIFCTGRYAKRNSAASPHVILLDLALPKVSGLEVLKKIKSDERTKIIPVIVVTVSKEDSDFKESYKLGVSGYITKPVVFEDFIRVVREARLFHWTLLDQPPK